MPFSVNTLVVSLLGVALMSACASTGKFFSIDPAKEIYYKDGRVAYLASCHSVAWGPCLEKAGLVCRNAGYTVLEKSDQRSYGEENKELVFVCDGKPDAPPLSSAAAPKALFPAAD